MGFFKTLVRAIILIFNILFMLMGIILLAFGIALKVAAKQVFELFTDNLKDAGTDVNLIIAELSKFTDPVGIGMIIVGVIIFIISLLGILGAVTLKKIFLVPYVILVILILLAEIVLIILVVALPANFQGWMITDFSNQDSSYKRKDSFGNYEATPPSDSVGHVWYLVQNMFACCGWKYDADFSKAQRNVTTSDILQPFSMTKPSSCCKQKSNITGIRTPLPVWNNTFVFEDFEKCKNAEPGFYNVEGCMEAFFLKGNTIPIIIVAITFALEVILILCSIVALCHQDKISV